METGTRETGITEQQPSFGIKKIVDCKIDAGGQQVYKVKWEATWEPAESLLSCQHLIDEFWSRVNNARRSKELEQQHRKRLQLERSMTNVLNMGNNLDSMLNDNKEELQGQIECSSGNRIQMLKSPSNLLSSHHQSSNLLMAISETPTHINDTDFPLSSQVHQNTRPVNSALQVTSPSHTSLNFMSPKKGVNVLGKKGKPGNKRSAPISLEADDSKGLVKESKLGDPCKPMNNTGLKYIENFENPYVKIVLVCKICNKEQSLKRHDTWKRHFLTHASKEDLPHKCTFCGKRFITSGNLKTHMKTHLKGVAGETVIKNEQQPWLGTPSEGVIKNEQQPWLGTPMQQY